MFRFRFLGVRGGGGKRGRRGGGVGGERCVCEDEVAQGAEDDGAGEAVVGGGGRGVFGGGEDAGVEFAVDPYEVEFLEETLAYERVGV